MILDILKLVDDDFCSNMEIKATCDRKITQEEAKEMASRLAEVYMIAHCEYCPICAGRYDTRNKLSIKK